jgi:SAM-dependent methyltransferase
MTSAPGAAPGHEPVLLECPVCGTPAPVEESFDDVRLHRCPYCDHCFTDVDSLDHLGVYDEAWEALHENWFANPNFSLFEFVAETIEQQSQQASVIDIGAGRGELLEYLRQRNPSLSLTGVDVSLQPEIDGVEVVRADINAVDFGERRWDVAVSLATIEHLADVQTFAARLRSMVLPGGIAIVMTNNERGMPYLVARVFRRMGYGVPFERLYDRHHLNHFNTKSLRTLMERNGFRSLVLRRHNIPLAAVDMPRESVVLKIGVLGTFALGRLTGRTFFQTLVLENRGSG